MPEYPPELAIEPLNGPVRATVRVPGSKSLTNRALVVAALAHGESTLTGALDSDDTRVMVEGLGKLGVRVAHDREAATIRVQGRGGPPRVESVEIDAANSGTTLRFLTALAASGRGKVRLDGTPRMRQRPVADLLLALNGLGADARSEAGDGCPPVVVRSSGLDGGVVPIRGDVSSQFLSGLLMVLPTAAGPTSVEVEGPLVSKPYVAMTLGLMGAFGVPAARHGDRRFNVEPTRYRGRPYAIEPDASAASYFFGAAAICGGSVTAEGLGKSSLQGDLGFVDVLEFMGCRVDRKAGSTTVTADGPLIGVDVDMNAISDTVMTLAVVSLFAQGITRIGNVGHIRHKETDRLAAVATELRKLGATVEERPDGLLIVPPDRVTPARIATYDDHRMAMAFAPAGLKVPGVVIEDPGCVSKTYPGFWDDLARLRG